MNRTRNLLRIPLWGAAWAWGLVPALVFGEWKILPNVIELEGPQSRQRVIVEDISPAGLHLGPVPPETLRWESSDSQVVEWEEGKLVPRGNGTATVTAFLRSSDAAKQQDSLQHGSVSCQVTVRGFANTGPTWEFRRHVLPVLSKAGCNSGACHGALAGKGGFRLSLRGYHPEGDYSSLTREAKGRRIELADPGRSLLLTKPSMTVPHKGGLRLEPSSDDFRLISQWISAGAPGPRDRDPKLTRLEVLPSSVMMNVGATQPLIVRAYYDDGRQEDVTSWAKFTATRESVANVDTQGQVQVTGHGEGAIVVWFSSQIVLARVTAPFPQSVPADRFSTAPRRNVVDTLVLDQLQRLNLPPSPRSSDTDFVRRVYLDTIGKLPTPDEVTLFLADTRVDKRDRLIETLLSRDEFVDYWAYKWSDVLLVSSRRLRPVAVKAYYDWIREQIQINRPWDQLVRDVITATGESQKQGATNFYSLHQSPEEMMENACQSFLGLSIGCAKCHNHPLEKWTNDQYYAMASHFSRVRAKGWGGDARGGDGLRTVYVSSDGELVQPTRGVAQPPTPLDGIPLDPAAPGDRRQHLARWLTDPANPYFARSIANRIWANFFGIGLVNPIDDLRMSNPASNEPLLNGLADHLRDQNFDLKGLMRLILQSETYQRSSEPLPENAADHDFFSRYFPRRLSAEVLLDAIADVTEVPSEFTQIGYDGNDFEKTEAYPKGTRALELSDSSVVSDFLKTFGRNERDITCECERSNTPSIVQVLHIHNGQTINQRLASLEGSLHRQFNSQLRPDELINQAFLKSLSRLPHPEELQTLSEMITSAPGEQRREVLEDMYWSILSSREFLFNH